MRNLCRVTVSLPAEVLEAADLLAKRLDRSRSWVVADALRRLTESPSPPGGASAVKEPAVAPYAVASGLGPQRLGQLDADLRLTPEQRIHAAEEGIETALRFHRPPHVARVLAFATSEDYLEWKRRNLLW
jgi:hypothetical protein